MSEHHDHSHAVVTEENSKKLMVALGLTTTFLIVEVVAAFITQSLALLSDAAHMFTDVAALAIALAAIKIGKKAADDKRTFGYQRFEILAALFNAVMLFVVAIYIVYEAYQRFTNPAEIQSVEMMIVAVIGLVVNLISMKILSASAEGSLNIKGSIGVIIGGIVIYFTQWMWVDTVIAVLIGFWVLPRTWILLKQSINILLEGVPDEIDIESLRNDLLKLEGVEGIHQLKVWAISSKNIHLTAHLVAPNSNTDQLYQKALDVLKHNHSITEITLQIESTECNTLEQHKH